MWETMYSIFWNEQQNMTRIHPGYYCSNLFPFLKSCSLLHQTVKIISEAHVFMLYYLLVSYASSVFVMCCGQIHSHGHEDESVESRIKEREREIEIRRSSRSRDDECVDDDNDAEWSGVMQLSR